MEGTKVWKRDGMNTTNSRKFNNNRFGEKFKEKTEIRRFWWESRNNNLCFLAVSN